jgi:hypothetical protein
VLQTRFTAAEVLTLYFMMKLADMQGDAGLSDEDSLSLSAWLRMLPQSYHGILMWSPSQLQHIKDSHQATRIREMFKAIDSVSNKIFMLLSGAPASARSAMKLLQLPRATQEALHHSEQVIRGLSAGPSAGHVQLQPALQLSSYLAGEGRRVYWIRAVSRQRLSCTRRNASLLRAKR